MEDNEFIANSGELFEVEWVFLEVYQIKRNSGMKMMVFLHINQLKTLKILIQAYFR